MDSQGNPFAPGYAHEIHVWVNTGDQTAYYQWKDGQFTPGSDAFSDEQGVVTISGQYISINQNAIQIQITTGSLLRIDRINGTLEWVAFAQQPNWIVSYNCVKSTEPIPAAKF